MKTIYTLTFLLLVGSAFAQNKLPTCKGNNQQQWNSCTGTIKADDGSAYEGDFANGQMDGYGLLTLPSGEKVLGQFKKSVLSGRGLLVAKDGSRYAGEFDQNIFNGQGISVMADGERIEGIFRNGQFVEAKKVTDAQILALLAAPPVFTSVTILTGKADLAEYEKTTSQNQEGKSNQNTQKNQTTNSSEQSKNIPQQPTNKYSGFKNKSGIYYSIFLDNKTPRICAISSENDEKPGEYAGLLHNVAIVSFATDVEKYKPESFSLPSLIKPSVKHPFMKQRDNSKGWLPIPMGLDYEHFENHDAWAEKFVKDGFHQYISQDTIDKVAKGQYPIKDQYPMKQRSWLPPDKSTRDEFGCSILVGFEEHIQQATVRLKKSGHKFLEGKPVKIDQLLSDYSEKYWSVKWQTYEYVRFNVRISPSSMILLRGVGLDSEAELTSVSAAIKSGKFEGEYFSSLKNSDKSLLFSEDYLLDVYIQDLHTAKVNNLTLINAKNSRQKTEGILIASFNEKKKKDAVVEEKERVKRDEANNAEAIAREKRRDALRANMTISAGLSCLADEYIGHQEITYITNMYASNTNIANITSYIQNSRICKSSRLSYPAKNFAQLNGIGRFVILKSRKPTEDGNFIFLMVAVKDWNVD